MLGHSVQEHTVCNVADSAPVPSQQPSVTGGMSYLSDYTRQKRRKAVSWRFFPPFYGRQVHSCFGGGGILITLLMFTAHIRDSPIKGKIRPE
jgi:hypothetical protein